MPALKIFGERFTTRPFAGDDLQIVCLISGLYRIIQFICIAPLVFSSYLKRMQGKDIIINDIWPHCPQYKDLSARLVPPFHVEDIDSSNDKDSIYGITLQSIRRDNFHVLTILVATAYLASDVAWICMVWSAASTGTPTQPGLRTSRLRRLIHFKLFASNLIPAILLADGIWYVIYIREDNYNCGDGVELLQKPDDGPLFGFFSTLLVTFALELLIWPAVIANHFIRRLKTDLRSRRGESGKAKRMSTFFGLLLKILQCCKLECFKNSAEKFQNTGELDEWARNMMNLMNNEVKFDLVLSDMYVGLKMLARVQAEKRLTTVEKLNSKKNKKMPNQLVPQGSESAEAPNFLRDKKLRRSTMNISMLNFLTKSNCSDQETIKALTHFIRYARCVYSQLRQVVEDDFMREKETSLFERDTETLFERSFQLASIGLDTSMLCFANFENSLVKTPFAIIIDEDMKHVVIALRGTFSIEDCVSDMQYTPESLEEVGQVCGFAGNGHFCHSGFLARGKWLYNEIKRTKVLHTLYSTRSPFKNYRLALCGHSLGAGCATILALMLKPSFPTLCCYAFCPPGGTFDEDLSQLCDDFMTSIVHNDDIVPRLSHQNFGDCPLMVQSLLEENFIDDFFTVFSRINVPKIDIFYDLRTPCSDYNLSSRNARTLLSIDEVPTDTEFYKLLERYRAARDKKERVGNIGKRLFIPGKIVHFVDISESEIEEKKYTCYWARRTQFNNVQICPRMLSDHSIVALQSVLLNISIDDFSSVDSLSLSPPSIPEDNLYEFEFHLFVCCSNPYGKLPIMLSLIVTIAVVLSFLAMSSCELFVIDYSLGISTENTTFDYDPVQSTGLFGYILTGCNRPDGDCHTAEQYVDTSICVPYMQTGELVDLDQTISIVFAGLTLLFGGLSMFLLWVSTCYMTPKNIWRLVAFTLTLSSFCQGMVILFLRSKGCHVNGRITMDNDTLDDFLEETIIIDIKTDCDLNVGAVNAIFSCCLYFCAGVLSIYFTKWLKEHSNDSESMNVSFVERPITVAAPHPIIFTRADEWDCISTALRRADKKDDNPTVEETEVNDTMSLNPT